MISTQIPIGGKVMVTAAEIISKLDLKPLPDEGGFYRETYRSDSPQIAASQFGIESSSTRRVSTAIYYLVTPESFSTLHIVKSDEIFHFYAGDPVEMMQIDSSGKTIFVKIGNDFMKGEAPQVLAPKGVWQGTRLVDGGKWALMGTTVAPGFEFEDFELGERDRMIRMFPHLETNIIRFTKETSQANE